MTYFLPRVVGPSRALEILINDPNIKPEDALADRLVTEVVPADELMDRAREKAAKLATKSPYYIRNAKKLIHGSLDHTITEHLQIERHAIAVDARSRVKAGLHVAESGRLRDDRRVIGAARNRRGRIRTRLAQRHIRLVALECPHARDVA